MTRVASTEQVASGASPVRRFAAHTDLVASRRSAYTRLLYPCTGKKNSGCPRISVHKNVRPDRPQGAAASVTATVFRQPPLELQSQTETRAEYLKHSARHTTKGILLYDDPVHLWSSRQMHARMRRPRRPQHACCMIHHQRIEWPSPLYVESDSNWSDGASRLLADDPWAKTNIFMSRWDRSPRGRGWRRAATVSSA